VQEVLLYLHSPGEKIITHSDLNLKNSVQKIYRVVVKTHLISHSTFQAHHTAIYHRRKTDKKALLNTRTLESYATKHSSYIYTRQRM
jgi:hypothetical protein